MIAIYGAGGLGRELLEWMRRAGGSFQQITVCDDQRANTIDLATESRIEPPGAIKCDVPMLIAVADPQTRQAIAATRRSQTWHGFQGGLVAKGVHLGPGHMLMPYSLVSVGVTAGSHLILNPYASIGHDAMIGYCVTLCSHVDICGGARIGDRVFVGSGASILPGVVVGDDAYIGAGAVVVDDVAPGQRVFGVPARRISTGATR